MAITGHTGFKGSWLTFWLARRGATVSGYSLKPNTEPSLFEQLDLSEIAQTRIGDIRDRFVVQSWLREVKPDVVFHLAAQPLVLPSYHHPHDTWMVNVVGTINLLEGLRNLDQKCAVVVVTSDKVYQQIGGTKRFLETDQLGGRDPYSSSKAAVELAVSSWRDSFFSADSAIRIATARAGNVLGGGDWARHRVIPDLVRALISQKTLQVRKPSAIRPWQHVLDPLAGYIRLAEKLFSESGEELASAFNFGPDVSQRISVQQLIEVATSHWSGQWQVTEDNQKELEEQELCLSSTKAKKLLGWESKWSFEKTILETIAWYRAMHSGTSARDLCDSQLKKYWEA